MEIFGSVLEQSLRITTEVSVSLRSQDPAIPFV